MKIKYFIALFLSVFLFACDNDSENSSVSIRLTDAPSDYEAVWLDIQGIEIHFTTESGDGQWISLENINKGLYNLLDYSNGKDTLLISTDITSGNISQIRLILGDQNSLVTAEGTFPLSIPSSSTSGLKFNLHETLEPGITKNIWIDFDASKSIVKSGNGSYHLKPVIRAYTESTSGAIKGFVNPKASLPTIYAILGSDTLSTIADTSGYFMIGGTPEGTYTVKFAPVQPYLSLTIDGV